MWFDDLRHAVRSLRRSPSLTTTIVLTAAIGIGASTSLFSVVKAVLLNPLPYPEPQRLVWASSLLESAENRTSLADLDDWREQNHTFARLAAYSEASLVAGGGNEPQHTAGASVTEDFFDVLGVHPALGHVFSLDDHRRAAPLSVVVIADSLWRRAYGGDARIVGRKITVVGIPSTVIGVMPPGFSFPEGTELWFSARALKEGAGRTAHNFRVVGRLRPGMAIDAARSDLSSIARRLKQEYPGPFQMSDAGAVTLASHLVGSVRTPLILLFSAVGLLLLIVCVNIANLLLVRLAARSNELAVRAALGASGPRLFRHLFVESAVLAAAGGALGLLFAAWSTDLFRVLLPASIPRAAAVQIDAGVVGFALAVSALAAILFGTLPSWRATRLNINDMLKASRSKTAARRSQRTQSALVISEVALSVVLLAGAGLLLSSFARLRAVDPGFRADHVLSAHLTWPVNPAERKRLVARYADLLERVRTLPGVESAGTIQDVPFDPIQRNGHLRIESRPELNAVEAGHIIVTPGLMEALHVSLIRGRRFTEADTADSPGAVIVSAEMARRFWPGRDPIGERVWFDSFDPKPQWLSVVGVAGDVRQHGLIEPVPVQAYVCYTQLQIPAQLVMGSLMVRAAGDPRTLTAAIRKAVHDVNPEAAATFRTMDDVLAAATSRQRFQLQVLGSFAVLAVLLAAIGLYGVLSYTVASTRAAIGVRIALGARPADVFIMVLRRAFVLVLSGALLGAAACLALGGLLQKMVYGVSPGDPLVLGAAAVIMATVALAACCFPARRAMSVDPLSALRVE